MDTKYKFQCIITLGPGRNTTVNRVRISLDQNTWYDKSVSDRIGLSITEFLSPGNHRLVVDFLDKPDQDLDQSLKIHSLCINSVSDSRFIWAGIYRPRYPNSWYYQQIEKGIILDDELTNIDYLGWPGTWTLDFTSPVFTWIHQIQSLGWIYD